MWPHIVLSPSAAHCVFSSLPPSPTLPSVLKIGRAKPKCQPLLQGATAAKFRPHLGVRRLKMVPQSKSEPRHTQPPLCFHRMHFHLLCNVMFAYFDFSLTFVKSSWSFFFSSPPLCSCSVKISAHLFFPYYYCCYFAAERAALQSRMLSPASDAASPPVCSVAPTASDQRQR